MAADSRSVGNDWVAANLRRLLGIRGEFGASPGIVEKVSPVVEIRPQLPWEFFRAGWTLGALTHSAPAVAGQFAVADVTNPAGTGRYALCQNFEFYNPGVAVALYVNRALINPTKGAGVLDGRAIASTGSWLTPMITGMAVGSLAALPVAADRLWIIPQGANGIPPCKVPPILLAPGQTVSFFGLAVNVNFDISCEVWEIPAGDLD